MVRNVQYTSIKQVLDNLLDHDLLRDVTIDQAVRYTLRFIAKHGFPQLYEDKLADVEIHKFRGELPCDLISIQQVREKCSGVCLRAMTKTFNPGLKDCPHPEKEPPKAEFPQLVNGYPAPHFHPVPPPPYMDGMDRIHYPCCHPDEEMSFKTLGRVIYTSFPEGVVELAYKAIPVDDDGYPLIIDDENYIDALEAYIKVRVFTNKFETGKVTDKVLENAKGDYAWASAQLMDTMTVPSLSEAEALSRVFQTLIPSVRSFDNGFKTYGNREYLRKHQ